MQNALETADNYIAKEKIDVSGYYLFLVKPNPYQREAGWLFSWARSESKKQDEVLIEITVTMNGTASRVKK